MVEVKLELHGVGEMYISAGATAARWGKCLATTINLINDERMKEIGFPKAEKIRNKLWFRLADVEEFERAFPEKYHPMENWEEKYRETLRIRRAKAAAAYEKRKLESTKPSIHKQSHHVNTHATV